MQTIKHILLATDFSTGAEAAIDVAFEMTRRFSARLTLLHVYLNFDYITTLGNSYSLPPDIINGVRIDTERALADLRKRAEQAGIFAETLALEGIAADVIVNAAHARRADLIVMGTSGRTGVPRFLLGSVAERVVRTAECPVLTVRNAAANLAATAD